MLFCEPALSRWTHYNVGILDLLRTSAETLYTFPKRRLTLVLNNFIVKDHHMHVLVALILWLIGHIRRLELGLGPHKQGLDWLPGLSDTQIVVVRPWSPVLKLGQFWFWIVESLA